MSAKKQTGLADTIREAATGYTVVVLGIVCFLITLAVVMAGVRVIVGTGTATTGNVTTAQANTTATTNASRSGMA